MADQHPTILPGFGARGDSTQSSNDVQFGVTIIQELVSFLRGHDQPVYLVGGAVRDLLLGRPVKDLDFVVGAGAVSLTFSLANRLELPAYILDRERDIGRIVIQGADTFLDFSQLRGADLSADLRGRDFTINAMALPVEAITKSNPLPHLIDPIGGIADLEQGQIVLASRLAILNDPIRALRAVRLAHELNFTISKKTSDAIQDSAPTLVNVSNERLRDEFIKILSLPQPNDAIISLSNLSLLPFLLPEIVNLQHVLQSPPHHEDVFTHTMRVVQNIIALESQLFFTDPTDNPRLQQATNMLRPYQDSLISYLDRPIVGGLDGRLVLRLSALFHDVGKPDTLKEDMSGRIHFFGHETLGSKIAKERLRKLKFSNEAVDNVAKIVSGHMRPLLLAKEIKLSRRAIFRYFRTMGTSGLDCCFLSLADFLAIHLMEDEPGWNQLLAVVDRLLEQYFQYHEESIDPIPVISGTELIELLNLEPGPKVGWLLRNLKEAQVIGEISSQKEAIEFARQLLDTYQS